MTIPEIDHDLWIEQADLRQVDLAVDHITDNLRNEMTAIHVAHPPKIRTARLLAAGGKLIETARDIQANTDGPSSALTVSLIGFPNYAYQPEYRKLAADLPSLSKALRPVLAHEAVHVRQLERGGSAMNDKRIAASQANKKAAETQLYADYIAYVGHGIEIAAHATQLAVEVLDTNAAIATYTKFEDAALKTWLWSHVEFNRSGRSFEDHERAAIFAGVQERLLKSGWFAYERLI